MAAATYTTLYTFRLDRRQLVRRVRVDMTSLATGANTIAHGIKQTNNSSVGAVPKEEQLLPTDANVIHRTQAADATNLYYTVDSGAQTTASVFVTV